MSCSRTNEVIETNIAHVNNTVAMVNSQYGNFLFKTEKDFLLKRSFRNYSKHFRKSAMKN